MRIKSQRINGFTLLELLVVVTLLAVLASVALLANDGVNDQAELDATRFEMAELRKALLQFRRDVGHFPATLSMLRSCTTADDPECQVWDKDTHRGWNGPYLTNIGDGFVTIGDNLTIAGTGSPILGTATQTKAVADGFVKKTVGNYFVWQSCTTADPACDARTDWGRPYLLFDTSNDYARIVSMGPDGVYDSAANAAVDRWP